MLRSLNSHILLSYIVIILICLLVVGLGLFVFVRTGPLWTRGTFLRLDAAVQATVPLLRRAAAEPGPASQHTERILLDAADDQDLRILLLDNTGRVLFDTDGDWQNQQLPDLVQIRIPNVLRKQGAFEASDGTRWAYVAEALSTARTEDRQFVAFVSPQARLLALRWYIDNLVPPLIRAGLVALLLSVLIAWVLARSVARPLRQVTATAHSLAQGNLDVRAPVSGPREVRELAHSFNSMADQVQATQQAQRDLVANVSHELKTPLTSIQGFSQALIDGTASGPEATARAAGIVHGEANRMRRMVDELLILARMDAGELKMDQKIVAIDPLLRECLDRLTPQAQESNVSLVLKSSEAWSVLGDSDGLAQAIVNLLDNAISHTSTGGSVTVGAAPSDSDQIQITVTDTGEGIPAEELVRVFERFYRVDKSRKHSRGAGLGLAIAKEIIEAHGGRITVESVVGLGSKFIVHLPPARTEKST